MLVLDTSATIDFLLGMEPNTSDIAHYLSEKDASLVAPHLIDAEVGQVLRRYVLHEELSVKRAKEALIDFQDMALTRYPHGPLLDRAFALHKNVTFYDALYLALAEALKCPLLTSDVRLANIPRCQANIELVGNSRDAP